MPRCGQWFRMRYLTVSLTIPAHHPFDLLISEWLPGSYGPPHSAIEAAVPQLAGQGC